MGIGILVCGLNGSGKSTIGQILANRFNFHFIDSEHLFFEKRNVYKSSRSHEQATNILENEIKENPNFIFASVKGEYGENFVSKLNCAIFVDVPEKIRLKRIVERDINKFGDRVTYGGDLYEDTHKFYEFVQSRDNSYVEKWLDTLSCEIIRIDGTKPIEENINLIVKHIEDKCNMKSKSDFEVK